MAQEVQTTLDYKAELNLIEWVWHQENKVKEHTQVEQAFGYECTASSGVALPVSQYERQSETLQGTLSIGSSSGITEFKIVNWVLRVPLAWPYLAHIAIRGGSSSLTVTTYIKVDWVTVYQLVTNNNNNRVETDIVLNLGRYNMVESRASCYYSGSWYSAGESYVNLTLKKL